MGEKNGTLSRRWEWHQRGQRKKRKGTRKRARERQEEKKKEEEEEVERKGRIKREDVASSSSYRVFGGPTSLDVGGQGGTDGPKRGFLFGVGLCSTTFPILK